MTYETPMFNLKAAVEKTGLKAHTLRAWERRYGLPKPQRSEGGHRLYSQWDVEIIKWLASRQGEGLNISRAVELWKQLTADGEDPLGPAPSPEPPAAVTGATVDALRQAWIEACLSFDEARADQIVVEASAFLDPDTAVTSVLQQGLSQIGDLWYAGKATIQQEHFATESALRRVEALIVASPPSSRRELIMAAGPPGERHGFSLLLATLLLRRRGWNVIHLGADVPLARLGETVAGHRPDMVISAAQQLPTAATLLEMAMLLHREGVTTAYGGWVFNRIPQLRSRIPGHFLGEHLERVPERVEALLGTPLPPPAEPLTPERLEALTHYREQRPLIEAEIGRFLEGLSMRGEHLAVAMQQLPSYLAAALSLCDLGCMDPCVDWIEGLLANLGLPDNLLPRYLQAYQQAASLHLDDRGEPVLNWLASRLEKVADRERHEPS